MLAQPTVLYSFKMRRTMYPAPSHSYSPAKVSVDLQRPSRQSSVLASPFLSGISTPLDAARRAPWSLSTDSLTAKLNSIHEDSDSRSSSPVSPLEAPAATSPQSKVARLKQKFSLGNSDRVTPSRQSSVDVVLTESPPSELVQVHGIPPAPSVDIGALNAQITDIAGIQNRLAEANPNDAASLRCALETMDCLRKMVEILTAGDPKTKEKGEASL